MRRVVFAAAVAELALARVVGNAQRWPDVLAAMAFAGGLAVALGLADRASTRVRAVATTVPVLVYGAGILLPVLQAQPAALAVGALLWAALLVRVTGGGGRPLGPRGAVAVVAGVVVFTWLLLGIGQGQPPPVGRVVAAGVALAVCGLLGSRAYWLVPLALVPDLDAERWSADAPAAGRDVVLITVDTLRLDTARTLPSFRDGTLLAASAPSPWTLPSLATLHTGVLPDRHGAVRVDLGIAGLDAQIPTLAERLGAAGWDTAATVETPFAGDRFGLSRGFARFRQYDARPWVLPRAPHTERSRPFAATLLGAAGVLPAEGWGAERRVEDVRELLAARRDRPMFLWVHFLDAHLPYRHAEDAALRTATRTSLGVSDVPRLLPAYLAEARRVDAAITEISALLRPDSLVILTSDHGEEFGEHGGFEHGHTVYEELLAVPLLVRGLDLPEAHAGLEDVVPTVLGALGIPFDGLDGHDLRRGRSAPSVAMNPLYGPLDLRAVRVGARKLIASGGTRAAFDLASDPGEQNGNPDDGALEALLPALPGAAGEVPPIDAATQAALRALGYLDETR